MNEVWTIFGITIFFIKKSHSDSLHFRTKPLRPRKAIGFRNDDQERLRATYYDGVNNTFSIRSAQGILKCQQLSDKIHGPSSTQTYKTISITLPQNINIHSWILVHTVSTLIGQRTDCVLLPISLKRKLAHCGRVPEPQGWKME